MSGFVHLTFDQVVELNARHCGSGAGVHDEHGIRAQLGRAERGFGGFDPYPTIFDKAAVILHGLSSTQYFHDGNKRTAWLATILFLGVNGVDIREMSDVEAEAFVLSIATKAFENEDEPSRGVEKAAEWFEAKRLTMRDRYHFAFLAQEAKLDGSSTFDATTALTTGAITSNTPAGFTVAVVAHIRWAPIDADQVYPVHIYLEDPDDIARPFFLGPEQRSLLDRDPAAIDEDEIPSELISTVHVTSRMNHPHHGQGEVMPMMWVEEFFVGIKRPGEIWFCLEIAGELFARLPYTISQSSLLTL